MIFKPSPEKAIARDLAAARDNLARLSARLSDAERAVTQQAAEAQRLAVDGDDAALDAAESVLRAGQDRVKTLNAAIASVMANVTGLERQRAELEDRKLRDETARQVELMARQLADAGDQFARAAATLVECVAPAARLLPDAHGVRNFAVAAQSEIGPAIEVILRLLRAHAAAAIDGSAPATLPKLIDEAATATPPAPAKSAPPTTVYQIAGRRPSYQLPTGSSS